MIYRNAKRIGAFIGLALLLISWYLIGTMERGGDTTSAQDLGFMVLAVVVVPYIAWVVGYITTASLCAFAPRR